MALRSVNTDLQAGLGVRWRGLSLSWIAHQTSAEYRTRGGTHA